MATTVTFALYDSATGLPITSAVPTFVDYRDRSQNAITQPAISHLGAGIYAFTPTDSDETTGVCWLTTNGVGVSPSYSSGSITKAANPFAVFFFVDSNGVLWTGAAPSVAAYKTLAGVNQLPQPSLVAIHGTYLYSFTPSSTDLQTGVTYSVAAAASAYPTYFDGSFTVPHNCTGVVTLLDIRNSCKQESDNVGQSYITDAEWNGYIGRSYQELYGLIVQAFGNDYFTQFPSTGYVFTTDGLNQFFGLPCDFFKLLGVDVQVSQPGNWVTLKPFAFADRNRLGIINSQIPQAGQTIRLFYVPRCDVPTVDADTLDGVNGWEEYIIVDACIKALNKEEADVSVFMARKQALLGRLASEIENRDAGSSARIVDVLGRRARAMQYRINGDKLWLIGNSMPGWGPYGDWGYDADACS